MIVYFFFRIDLLVNSFLVFVVRLKTTVKKTRENVGNVGMRNPTFVGHLLTVFMWNCDKTLQNMAIIDKYTWLWFNILIPKGLIPLLDPCKENNPNNDGKIGDKKVGQIVWKVKCVFPQMRCLLSWWSEFGPSIFKCICWPFVLGVKAVMFGTHSIYGW